MKVDPEELYHLEGCYDAITSTRQVLMEAGYDAPFIDDAVKNLIDKIEGVKSIVVEMPCNCWSDVLCRRCKAFKILDNK